MSKRPKWYPIEDLGPDKTRKRKTAIEKRKESPYGRWTCADGREVLYDRWYRPICQRYPGRLPTQADPEEWVDNIVDHHWFYNDGTPEAKKRRVALAVLQEWGWPAP
jgi:hypothetical protein